MRFRTIGYILFCASIILFGLYPLVPERHEGYVPIFFILASFILFLANVRREVIIWKALSIMSSLFVIFIFSAFLSNDLDSGIKRIETMSSLIGIPIACFLFLGNRKLDFNKIESLFFKTFFVSNIVFSLLAFYLLSFYGNPKFASKDSDFFRNAVTDIPYIGDHSIYISLFLATGILTGINIYGKQTNSLTKGLIIIGQLALVTLLLLLMSKGVIIGLIISFVGTLMIKSRNWKKIVFFGMSLLILALIILPKENNRFFELFEKNSFEKVDLNNSTSVRFHILKSSIGLILERPILGYGLGDVQKELDSRYKQNGIPLPDGKYNSHNQYIFIWLSCGIFGLVAFLINILYVFKVALNKNDFFLISITLLYVISFNFENILSRQSGVILYAFLVNLFVLKNLKKESEKAIINSKAI